MILPVRSRHDDPGREHGAFRGGRFSERRALGGGGRAGRIAGGVVRSGGGRGTGRRICCSSTSIS